MNEFLSALKAKVAAHPALIGHRLLSRLPFVTVLYSFVDFVNCIQRMKDGAANYAAFVDQMGVNVQQLTTLFFNKSEAAAQSERAETEYDIAELRKRWYFRLSRDDISNRAVMLELTKTLLFYLIELHLEDFMIRVFWSAAPRVFDDEEFVRCIVRKCNQMEITQLAEILNGCNVQRYAESGSEAFECKYTDIISKHCYSSINHNDNIAVLGWR